jgi:hypothetical protein
MEEAGGKRWKGTDPPASSDQQAIQPSELCNGVRKQTRLLRGRISIAHS